MAFTGFGSWRGSGGGGGDLGGLAYKVGRSRRAMEDEMKRRMLTRQVEDMEQANPGSLSSLLSGGVPRRTPSAMGGGQDGGPARPRFGGGGGGSMSPSAGGIGVPQAGEWIERDDSVLSDPEKLRLASASPIDPNWKSNEQIQRELLAKIYGEQDTINAQMDARSAAMQQKYGSDPYGRKERAQNAVDLKNLEKQANTSGTFVDAATIAAAEKKVDNLRKALNGAKDDKSRAKFTADLAEAEGVVKNLQAKAASGQAQVTQSMDPVLAFDKSGKLVGTNNPAILAANEGVPRGAAKPTFGPDTDPAYAQRMALESKYGAVPNVPGANLTAPGATNTVVGAWSPVQPFGGMSPAGQATLGYKQPLTAAPTPGSAQAAQMQESGPKPETEEQRAQRVIQETEAKKAKKSAKKKE